VSQTIIVKVREFLPSPIDITSNNLIPTTNQTIITANDFILESNNRIPHLIPTELSVGAVAGIAFAILVFVAIFTVAICVRKSGRFSKVYVTPGNKYMLHEGADPMMKNVLGETFDNAIFGYSEMDDIPGVEPDSVYEHGFGFESSSTKDKKVYGAKPPKPLNTYTVENTRGATPPKPPTMDNMTNRAYGAKPPKPPAMNNYMVENTRGATPPKPPTMDNYKWGPSI
jgi:hypothetical protein